MKQFLSFPAFTLFAVSLAPALGSAQASGTAPAPRHAATKPVPKVAEPKRHPDGRPLGVPMDAVKIGPASWRATEGGKPIVYRQTAFGYSKLTEEENAKIQRMIDGKPDSSSEVPAGMTVREKDGKLEFTRTTPFGPYTWTKDKSDLNPTESALWRQSQAKNAKVSEVRN
jgi:hypothetical protein